MTTSGFPIIWRASHLCFDDARTEFAHSRGLWVAPDGRFFPISVNLQNDDELDYLRTREGLIPACCVMYRRSCHDRVGVWLKHLPIGGDRHFQARLVREQKHASLRLPTSLHFKANWRSLESMRAWAPTGNSMRIAETSNWWPQALALKIPDGVTEQAAFHRAMTQGREKWVTDVRSAVDRVIDRLALDRVRDELPQATIEAYEATIAAQAKQLDDVVKAYQLSLAQERAWFKREIANMCEALAGGVERQSKT